VRSVGPRCTRSGWPASAPSAPSGRRGRCFWPCPRDPARRYTAC